MNKSPAFQWYPKDYLASARVAEMSLEEEGAYRRALDYCWVNGSIPADPERLARIIGKGASTLVATVVQAMFNQDTNDPSRMVHERLQIEREKQEAWRNKSAEGGKKSAKVRQQKKIDKMKGGSILVETNAQPNGNSSSSSSSSSKNRESAREPLPVNPETAGEIEAYFSPLRAILKTNTLPNQQRWLDTVLIAIKETLPPVAVAASLSELLKQDRKYPVTPENVINHAIEKRAKGETSDGFLPKTAPTSKFHSDAWRN